MPQVHTNTQLLAENSQKAVALRLGEDAMSRVRTEAAKARPLVFVHVTDKILMWPMLQMYALRTVYLAASGSQYVRI